MLLRRHWKVQRRKEEEYFFWRFQRTQNECLKSALRSLSVIIVMHAVSKVKRQNIKEGPNFYFFLTAQNVSELFTETAIELFGCKIQHLK